ncbi:MAG TPA: hypothetical protein VHC70_15235, partial [Phycisphaerales bacterium]|nr:hypothetical protein [Phycisphaerales bacterium]
MNVRRHRVSLLIGALVCCTGSALAQPSTGSGACCTRDSAGAITCTVSTLQACLAAHGLWCGPNTTCGANSCPTPPPPPTGA